MYILENKEGYIPPFAVLTHVIRPDDELINAFGEAMDAFSVEDFVIGYKEENKKTPKVVDIRGLVCKDPKCFAHVFDADFHIFRT